MSKEFELGGVWPCRKNIDKKLIAQGINSVVFRVDNYALKVYPCRRSGSRINIDKLRLYEAVTKEVSNLFESEKWTIALPFLGQRRLKVNCFIHVTKCKECGYLEAWAPFISGVKLNSLLYSLFNNRELENQLSVVSRQIERRIGVGGIDIVPVNVKSIGLKTCVVTDLCYDIDSLKKVNR